MENPYTAAPLNFRNHEIRLVRLEHSSDLEPIKCTLKPFILNEECPEYVALSYTWGSNERYADIQLNGIDYPVGRSLWSFLNQTRLQQRYATLWIDALSINQADVLEQNHQVQMMRQIYSRAQSVWVWLGEADKTTDSDMAMQFLATRKALDETVFHPKKFWSPKKAGAVLALCERVYWTRIWIVQEIILAKEAVILCGDKQMEWAKLQELISDLQAISDRGRAIHTIGVSTILNSPAAVIVRAKSQWDGSPQPLTKLLELYHGQQSTDIRDKVYALHGLAHNSDAIAINYNINAKDLLIEIIYHACSSQPFETDAKKSKKDVFRFAKMMDEVLKAHCTEEEILFHISVAQGDAREKEYVYGLLERDPLSQLSMAQPILGTPGPDLQEMTVHSSLSNEAIAYERPVCVDPNRSRVARRRALRSLMVRRPWSTARPRHEEDVER